MNARVGNKAVHGSIGTFGEETVNKNGMKLQEFAVFNNLKVTNTFFRKKLIHKFTWANGNCRSLIDYIIANQRISKQVMDTNVLRGYDIYSDHYLVTSRIKMYPRWRKAKKNSPDDNAEKVFKVHVLEEQSTRELYQHRLKEHIHLSPLSNNVEEMWANLKMSLTKAANEALGMKKKMRSKRRLKIWSAEIEELVKIKKKCHNKYLSNPTDINKQEYHIARNQAKKCNK